MNEYEIVPACPWGMCDLLTEDHSYCAKLFAGRVNDFTNEEFTIGIDPEYDFDAWDAWMQNWLKEHPQNTMMDNGRRIYNWRFIHMDGGEWRLEVGY